MDINALNKAKELVNSRRTLARELQENNIELCKQNKEYLQIYNQIKQNTLQLSHALAEDKSIIKFEKKDKELNAKLKELESKLLNGKNTYHCPICNDTGIVNGKYCTCLITEYKKILRENSGINGLPTFTFKDNNIANIKCKQSNNLTKLYSSMLNYCEEFPNNKIKNLLLCGKVGTGKSCVLSSTANYLLDKGFNCMYFTAFNLNSLFLKYHTTDFKLRGEIMDSLINADLLIIDDLGTEPIMKNVTIEYLTTLLNERMHKHTIIATNLSELELQNKYGDRVFSRITNKDTTRLLYLDGDDLRHIGK